MVQPQDLVFGYPKLLPFQFQWNFAVKDSSNLRVNRNSCLYSWIIYHYQTIAVAIKQLVNLRGLDDSPTATSGYMKVLLYVEYYAKELFMRLAQLFGFV